MVRLVVLKDGTRDQCTTLLVQVRVAPFALIGIRHHHDELVAVNAVVASVDRTQFQDVVVARLGLLLRFVAWLDRRIPWH
jgi:hypothetical protein